MAALSDKIVAVCSWLYDALVANGIPREKLILSRQGVSNLRRCSITDYDAVSTGRLRIGFIGRWDRVKGIDFLVQVMKQLPESAPVDLFIHAMCQDKEGEEYRREVMSSVGGDGRIHFEESLNREAVHEALAGFDVMAVPSQWLETGPLVVLEAQAAGTPVVGSNLGGIAELVKDGVDGVLLPHNDAEAWANTFCRLARHRSWIRRLRGNITAVRTMEDVANDMLHVYGEVIG